MSLREIAAADLRHIMADRETGFGWAIDLKAPDGTVYADLTGRTNDISQVFDPESGLMVSGRKATIAINYDQLAPGVTPVGVKKRGEQPWLVTFADINGAPHTFRVTASDPDRTLGCIVLILGEWG